MTRRLKLSATVDQFDALHTAADRSTLQIWNGREYAPVP